MEHTRELILRQQQCWATGRAVAFTQKGYVMDLADNLYEPLKPDSLDEFVHGRGGELENKMLALHSSSALVVNFFHYWRYRDLPRLTVSMGLFPQYSHMRFETTYPKPEGVKGIRPHVDVELTGTARPIAIESKFTEPYTRSRKMLRKAYIDTPGIWGRYAQCELLAKQMAIGTRVFEHLDAPQLLKHILGLKTKYGEGSFTLLYLWYDYESDEARRHRNELQSFTETIINEIDFKSMTYQHLFEAITSISGVDENYLSYLRQRYFPTSR
jgi:hypothetical protein